MANKSNLFFVVLSTVMLAACNFPLIRGSKEANALATSVAETVQALKVQPNLPQDQVPGALPTITPLPTLTQPAVQSPPTQTPLPCNKALFVSETIPDDTEFAGGEAIPKSWTFKNTGTCTWNTDYKLVFSSGAGLGGPASVKLPNSVAPNEQVTISVDLTAPAEPGTYTGYWKLQADDDEQIFGVYVRIKTKSVFFQVTSVSYEMAQTTYTYTAPFDVTIFANITTSAPGDVTNYWVDSQGGQSATQSVSFAKAETQTVNYTMTISAPGPHWAKIYIDQPNHQLFGPKNFTVN